MWLGLPFPLSTGSAEGHYHHIQVIRKSFNFLRNSLFYWLQNWDDFVSPEKKSICEVYAQTSHNTQAS
jgi:hypothetical protein